MSVFYQTIMRKYFVGRVNIFNAIVGGFTAYFGKINQKGVSYGFIISKFKKLDILSD
jgi:hypothetical protein